MVDLSRLGLPFDASVNIHSETRASQPARTTTAHDLNSNSLKIVQPSCLPMQFYQLDSNRRRACNTFIGWRGVDDLFDPNLTFRFVCNMVEVIRSFGSKLVSNAFSQRGCEYHWSRVHTLAHPSLGEAGPATATAARIANTKVILATTWEKSRTVSDG